MTDTAAPPPDPGGPPRNRTWPIAFGVTAALLVIALVALLLVSRSKDDSETSNAGTTVDTTVLPTTTAARSTSTTRAPSTAAPSSAFSSSPTSADSNPVNLECSTTQLRQAVDQSVLAADATVSQYACTPATVGDSHDAYAWARFTAPMTNDLFVLYSGYVGTEASDPQPVEWSVITYGTDWTCQQYIPVASCDMMPGVPR